MWYGCVTPLGGTLGSPRLVASRLFAPCAFHLTGFATHPFTVMTLSPERDCVLSPVVPLANRSAWGWPWGHPRVSLAMETEKNTTLPDRVVGNSEED